MQNEFQRKNHYVPQFYLNHWAIDGNVYVYNNLVSNVSVPQFQPKRPKGIAYIEHLYTDLEQAKESDDFEMWISLEVEAPYRKTQDKIFASKKLASDDYENLARYAMAQFLRVPYNYVGQYSSITKDLGPNFQKALKESITSLEHRIKYQRPLPQAVKIPINEEPIRIQKFSEGAQAYIGAEMLFGRKTWLHNIKRMVDKIAEKTRDHRWQIVRSIEGHSWFTSDNPVTLLNYTSSEKYDFNGAWKRKNTDIFMPISPQYLLFVEVGKKQRVENTETFQSFINKIIIENSFLQVYSTTPNPLIPKIRPRVIDTMEYNRIQEMLKSWHDVHTKSEYDFFDESDFHS